MMTERMIYELDMIYEDVHTLNLIPDLQRVKSARDFNHYLGKGGLLKYETEFLRVRYILGCGL